MFLVQNAVLICDLLGPETHSSQVPCVVQCVLVLGRVVPCVICVVWCCVVLCGVAVSNLRADACSRTKSVWRMRSEIWTLRRAGTLS